MTSERLDLVTGRGFVTAGRSQVTTVRHHLTTVRHHLTTGRGQLRTGRAHLTTIWNHLTTNPDLRKTGRHDLRTVSHRLKTFRGPLRTVCPVRRTEGGAGCAETARPAVPPPLPHPLRPRPLGGARSRAVRAGGCGGTPQPARKTRAFPGGCDCSLCESSRLAGRWFLGPSGLFIMLSVNTR
jgi:hypothetical protein